jgi:hypothetical protein
MERIKGTSPHMPCCDHCFSSVRVGGFWPGPGPSLRPVTDVWPATGSGMSEGMPRQCCVVSLGLRHLRRRGFGRRPAVRSRSNPLRMLLPSQKSRYLLSLAISRSLAVDFFSFPWVPLRLFSPHFAFQCFGYVSHTASIRSTDNPPRCSSSFPHSGCSQGT